MSPKMYLKKNLITSLIGVLGFLTSAWYLIVSLLMTITSTFSESQNIPFLSFVSRLPNMVYQHTNFPVINFAWKHATIMPFLSTEFTKDHLILIAVAAACGLFGGMAGDYPRAKAKINKFKREASDELLRRGVKNNLGIHDVQSTQNELRIFIESEKSWHESWWGVLLIAVIGGIILALVLNPFGLN